MRRGRTSISSGATSCIRSMSSPGDRERRTSPSGVFPPINVTQDADRFYVRAELPGVVVADMPGVKPDQLEIDLGENVLTLTGRVTAAPANETDVLREYDAGTFFRRFTLAEIIDQANIDAKLADGVLRLELPKLERAKPRQITVRTG